MKLFRLLFFILATRPVLVCAGPKKRQKTDDTSTTSNVNNNANDNNNDNSIALSPNGYSVDFTPTLEDATPESNGQHLPSGATYLRLVGRPPAP